MKLLLVVFSCLFAGAFALMNCRDDQWKCQNGECIPKLYVCDGEEDCFDGSDEDENTICRVTLCHGFRCNDTGRCIPESWVCDHLNDCADGSDEIGCACDDGFKCQNGNCLPSHWECDGHNDCGDKADEKNCPCPYGDDFKCVSDGHCIPAEYVCDKDHIQDCADNSDEEPVLCERSAVKGQKKMRKMQSLFIKEIQPSRTQLRQRHDKIKSRYGKH